MLDLKIFGVDETYLAHTKDETLKAHSECTLKYFNKIKKSKNLHNIIKKLIISIDSNYFDLIMKMFEYAIYLHDIGKKNPYFQANKMNNLDKKFDKYKDKTNSTKHSPHSKDEYIKYFEDEISKIKNRTQKDKLKFILYSFSYAIAKHHGKLESFEDYDEKCISFFRHYEKYDIKHFELYILTKLLFSLLISSDYYATTEYMSYKNSKEFDDFGLFSKKQKDDLKKRLDRYVKQIGEPKGINILRNEMCQTALTSLIEHKDKHIFYLEAPTGSGKTITSINLALTLLNDSEELNKLFYIFPFNTLTEQTKKEFDKIFGKTIDIEVINSITPIKEDTNQEEKETDYDQSYMNRLFYHSPAIISTHVNFFNILFGTSKEDNFPLWQFANSVIILDEIQSYNNHLWWFMIEFFERYAKFLNIKIIIMSATLPKLDYFLENKNNFVSLIDNEKRDYFFQNKYFKNRVTIDYLDIKDKEMALDSLKNRLNEESKTYNKILFEFISKKTARKFYNLIKDDFENVYELTGDDNKAYRNYVIKKAKKDDMKIIIIATQVIEAGIDIDMDLGFKDISTLDSEEQFMGRINRSCKKENAKVYFFDYDDETNIYKGDNRLGYNLKDKKYQEILENKEFEKYYKNVLEDIRKDKDRFKKGTMTDYSRFKENVQKLNYKSLSKTMTLISSEVFTLYFPFKIDISKYDDVEEFKDLEKEFLSDGELDGQKIWEEFLKLHEIENFTEMKVKKSKINSLMQFFTFNIFKYDNSPRPYIGKELYGFYYVEKWEEFITGDYKFDREKYDSIEEKLIL